jgi:hypothetical protein
MSVVAQHAPARLARGSPRTAFACGFVALAGGAAALAGWFPIEFSLATVFLFAGPHNWFEARYALGRLPARTGKLWGFFAVSAVGIVGLAGGYAAVPAVLPPGVDPAFGDGLCAVWGTAFLLWVAALVWLVLPPPFAGEPRWAYLLVAETFAPVAECAIFWFAFVRPPPRAEPDANERPGGAPARDFAVIALANLCSFGFGEVLIAAGLF